MRHFYHGQFTNDLNCELQKPPAGPGSQQTLHQTRAGEGGMEVPQGKGGQREEVESGGEEDAPETGEGRRPRGVERGSAEAKAGDGDRSLPELRLHPPPPSRLVSPPLHPIPTPREVAPGCSLHAVSCSGPRVCRSEHLAHGLQTTVCLGKYPTSTGK